MPVVVGAVLAGGASRRMGTDKALVRAGGVAMAARVADALTAAGATPVVLVGAAASTASALGLDAVADRKPGTGPLGGLATILSSIASPSDRPDMRAGKDPSTILVVAGCDQPSLTAGVIGRLVDALAASPADVGAARLWTEDGRTHPLPSAWRAAVVAQPVAELFGAGERRIGAAFDVVAVVDVAADPDEIVDLDTPTDVARWHRAHGRAHPESTTDARRLPVRPTPAQEQQVDVPEIDIAEAARRHGTGTPVIDVREPDEYVEGHVPGAPLIPLATVPDRVGDVPASGEVLIICKSGGRSRKAAEHLRSHGVDAVNVAGGTMGWIDAGHRVVTGDQPGT